MTVQIVSEAHAIHPEKIGIREFEQALEQELRRQGEIWDNLERVMARMDYIDEYVNEHSDTNPNYLRDLFTEFLLLRAQSQEHFELYNRQRERVRLAQRRRG